MAVITRLYDTYELARAAVSRLSDAGVPQADVSLVANNSDNAFRDRNGMVDRDGDGVDDRAEGAGTGAGVGATLGGAAGLLAGLGLLAIPGIGPVVAAGWLASTALGAVVGGTAGGLVGALTQAGVDDDEADTLAEGVRRGGTLVTVRSRDADRARIENILDQNAVDVRSRRNAYEASGWKNFDAGGKGMTAEEIRRERENYMG